MRGFSIAICRSRRALSRPRETVVQVARCELAAHLQPVHLAEQLGPELRHRNRVVDAARPRLPHGVQRLTEEVRDRDACNRLGILESQEEPRLRALVRTGFGDVRSVEQDLPAGDLVGRVTGDRVGERRLAGAVRPHHRVHLARGNREIDTLHDLGAVLERDLQVFSSSFAIWDPGSS
jgi:hypothetical protein